jgi:hypothetical protein
MPEEAAMPVRGLARTTVVVVLITTTVLARPSRAGASTVSYQAPVDAPVSDPFRPPANPWDPGNRGIEYDTPPDTVVEAAADGDVTFAGPVAGVLWVTLGHADGVRTTYGPLASVAVAQGQAVRQGQEIGTTAGRLLFTARQNGEYIDPAKMLAGGGIIRLLPVPPRVDFGGVFPNDPSVDAVATTLVWLRSTQPDVVAAIAASTSISLAISVGEDMYEWHEQSGSCTDAAVPPPPPSGRRAAILVAGLGSTSESASIDHVPTAQLGYAPPDVMRFSYAGGRTPVDPAAATTGGLATIAASTYTAADTLGDLRDAGERLAELIIAAAAALPDNVPIDVIAHSQGGLVTRVAVTIVAARRPDLVARLGLVATIATPHHGATLAEIVSMMADDPRQGWALDAFREASGEPLDPSSAAVHELAPGSTFLHELDHSAIPAGLHVLSIGGRGDLVVPLPSTDLDGAAHATVPIDGLSAHDQITSTAGVERELALGIGGLPPTCEGWFEALTDSFSGHTVAGIETAIAAFRP